jgi:nucleoside-diphosphate-sugar epimerase
VALVRTPRAGDNAYRWSLGSSAPGEALSGITLLIHCAYDFGQPDPAATWHVNVEGTRLLLQEAAQAGIPRVLSLSSMSAYSGTKQLYGQTKMAIEDITTANGGIAVRPGLVYGLEARGMAGTLMRLTRLPAVPVFRDARQFPVHEADFADAILRVAEASEWTPESFGIAQETAVSFTDLLTELARLAGQRCRFVPVPWKSVYYLLRGAEMLRLPLPVRSDSLLGLVRPAPMVPRSTQFPGLLDRLRTI